MIGVAGLLLLPAAAALVAVRRRRTYLVLLLAMTGWLATSVVVMLVLLLQVAFVSEGTLPPDDLPDRLPTGVQVADRGRTCGSGGCARHYVLQDDRGSTRAALAERVEQTVMPGCRRRQWVPDLREHCTDVDIIDDRVVVHTYLQGF